MGYSEVYCKLCGVSFNIGRIRRADEPYHTAWHPQRGEPDPRLGASGLGSFISKEDIDMGDGCLASSGCRHIVRKSLEKVPKDSEENNKNEFVGHIKDSKEPSQDYISDGEDEVGSSSDSTKEHLAGPGCLHSRGYSGFRISAGEMKGCATVQCLMSKDEDWCPQPDDQSFEVAGDYFLSGLSRSMPGRDEGGLEVIPARHGANSLNPDTSVSICFDEFDTPMPFHPTCFEVFTRASRFCNQHIDFQGLAEWRKLESDFKSDDDFPRHEAVHRGASQDWNHQPGDEWLAANPIIVPLLPSLLEPAIHDHDKSFGDNPSYHDYLANLPREISNAIFDLLTPTDIASLRLASCAIHLPISNWRALLQEEMPWLWEVWDDAEPSFWATVSASALAVEKQRREDAKTQPNQRRAAVQEGMPELPEACHDEPFQCEDDSVDDWDAQQFAANAPGASDTKALILNLPAATTNWCRVYYEIKTHWEDLKGLKNRQRIWADVTEILRRIQQYREAGKIS